MQSCYRRPTAMASEPPAAKQITERVPRLARVRDDALGRDRSIRTLVTLLGRRAVASVVSRQWRDAARSVALTNSKCDDEDSETRQLVHAVAADHTNLHLLANFRYYNVTVIDLRARDEMGFRRRRDFTSARADAAVIALAAACPNCSTIYLAGYSEPWNLLSSSAIIYLASHCPKLTNLDLSGWGYAINAAIAAFANKRLDLTTIDLSQNSYMGGDSVTATTVEILATGFPNLTSIDLCGCGAVTNDAVAAIVNGCPKLTSIILIDCEGVTGEFVENEDGSYHTFTKSHPDLHICWYLH